MCLKQQAIQQNNGEFHRQKLHLKLFVTQVLIDWKSTRTFFTLIS